MARSTTGRWELVVATAAAQYGLVNVAQLMAAGYSRNGVRHLVGCRILERIAPRVYRIGGMPGSWHQELMTAHLWAGEDSYVTGRPAAALWGLADIARTGVDVAVFRERRPNGLDYRVRRLDPRLAPERTTVDNIPVASLPMTVLLLAGAKDRRTYRALDDALFRKHSDLAQMWLFVDRHWMKGRRGIRIMRNALRERTTGMAPTPSVLSDLFKRIVVRYGLPQPDQEYPIEIDGKRRFVDFAYPDVKLAIECDSRVWHLEEPESYDGDMERSNALQLMGWRLLRFGWAKLRFEPKWVADTVLAHLTDLTDLHRAVVLRGYNRT